MARTTPHPPTPPPWRWAWVACLLGGAWSANAQDLLSDIVRRGHLRVCTWPHYHTISYRHPHTGRWQGLDVEMAQALANDLNVALRWVPTDFAHFTEDLLQQRCDIAMMGVAITAQRSQHLRFSEPYLVSDFYAVTTAAHPSIRAWDDIDQPPHIVVVQPGTVQAEVVPQLFQRARVKVSTGASSREADVASGRADVFITDYPYTRRLSTDADWARVLAPPNPVHPTPYAYAVAPGHGRWLERVNQFVRAIKRDGRLRTAAAAHDLLPIVAD